MNFVTTRNLKHGLLMILCIVSVLEAAGDTKKRSQRVRQDFEFTLHACNCNGKSNRCFFDRELFDRTGHGGHCLDCEDNTEGVNCERCKPLHYRREADKECAACNCDSVGSTSSQCAPDGQCPCKPGVGTRTCSRCAPNFYDMSPQGCRPCGCNAAGIAHDIPCDPSLGACPCKDNVVGQKCDRCKTGHFDLQLGNEFGCVPCFCYGHTNQCATAPGFYKRRIESTFDGDAEGWTAVDLRGRPVRVGYDADLQIISVRRQGGEFTYFLAPESYLGNQRASYNQYLRFDMRIGAESPRISDHDIILEGAGLRVSLPITEQRNPKPSHRVQEYKFRLHEHPDFGWTPRLNAFDFIKILSNLTAIKIKATYTRVGVGYLDNVVMESAYRTPGSDQSTWVEQCSCPEGYTGLSCEQCAPGYRRDPPGDSPYSRCVKCFCHNHADDCEAETGRCICMHYTEGNNCERCATGYHGDARRGTPGDCKPCLCPDRGPCVVLPGGAVACQQCPMGSTGHQCDMCIDGYYGDPLGRFGPPRPCKKCECSDNIDPNAVGNCNTTTGQCLKCIYNTAGWNCERCLPGYFGDALAVPKGNCKRCLCHLPGTIIPERASNPCETTGGQCRCKSNVVGRRCDRCRNGYWNIDSGEGCEPCNCNRIGSVNQTCDVRSGQCHCRPGVTGRHCDQCAGYHYGFSEDGCKACDCDPEGSVSLQCDTLGQCQCRPNREGRNCRVCKDNKYSRGTVCIDCPPCYYDLLEKGIDKHKKNLTELANLLSHIGSHPDPVEDLDFQQKLREAMKKIDNLSDNAKKAANADKSLVSQLNNLRERIRQIQDTAGRVTEKLGEGEEPRLQGLMNIKSAETVIQQAQDAAASARRFLDNEVKDAYNSAVLRFQRLGQQSENLTKIARVAKELADQQQKDSEAIEIASNEALNTSAEAYRLAEEALRAQATMQEEVRDLTKRLDDLSNFMERTLHLANGTKREAGEAYDAALDIYADANSIVVPTADVQEKKDEAARIKAEASRIKGDAESLANRHKSMLSEIDGKTRDAQNLLDEAIRQQQITDELLTDTDAALAKAHNAIAAGERIIDDANDTLTTLKGFDQEVQASKDKAGVAMRKFPEVENMVTDAESKTREAQDALSGALQNATEARGFAQDAKRIAEQASEESDDIRKEADRTKAEAEKLGDQVKDLTDDIDDTDKRMKVFEDEAEHDSGLAKEALEAAHEAQTSAGKASGKARNASKMLDDILDELDNLDVVDNTQLDDLERRLALAERELRHADLDAKAAALREAQEEQQRWMKDYEDEIEQLRRDVANVAAIRRSLPEDCYRRLVLEP